MTTSRGNILLVVLTVIGIVAVSVGGYFWWTAPSKWDLVVPDLKPIQKQEPDVAMATQSANWKTYTNSEHGFSFKYPNAWNQGNQNTESGNVIVLTPAPIHKIGYQIQAVYVHVVTNPKLLTSREYYDQVLKPGQEGSVCTDPSINANVPVSLKNLDVTIIEGTCGILSQGPRMVATKDGYTVDISSSFVAEVDTSLVYQILSTFKFLDQASITSSPTIPTSKKLTYFSPSGWKTIQDKTGTIQLGYDPEKGYVPSPDSTGDLSINLSQIGPYGGQYFSLELRAYDGGSRHKFILPENFTLTSQDKTAGYHEKEYLYNGWFCLVLYGISVSQWFSTEGMCAVNSSQAFWFGSWMSDVEMEKMISTIRLLK